MMRPQLSAENAAQIIESAFAPLRCVAEPWDYGHRIRFRVFDSSDNPVLTVEELLKKQFSDAVSLASVIDLARGTLEQRGFDLADWMHP